MLSIYEAFSKSLCVDWLLIHLQNNIQKKMTKRIPKPMFIQIITGILGVC